MVVSPVLRKSIRVIASILVFAGFSGFFGQAIAASGTFGQMRAIPWPVGDTSDAVRLPDGRYAVPLCHIGRVQIYSADLHFLYGWQVEAGSGVFTLLSAREGRLEIYTPRGQHHYVFTPGGNLLSSRVFDFKTEKYPSRDPDAVSLTIPSPWWTYPLRGPFYSWIMAVIGLVLCNTKTREERDTQRRKAAERTIRSPEPTFAVVKRSFSWFAAVVWAAVGVFWFVSAVALVIKCTSDGNVGGLAIAIPFLLIGGFLLFISVTIIRHAIGRVYRFITGMPR
jgi:hypothetical protein